MKYTQQEILAHLKKWEEALLSGEYTPTTGTLKRIDKGYCCLGVACEISNLGDWEPIDDLGMYTVPGKYDEFKDSALLPAPVAAYYGFKGKNVLFTVKEEEEGKVVYRRVSASEINDNPEYGNPFPYIAKLLREQYINPLENTING